MAIRRTAALVLALVCSVGQGVSRAEGPRGSVFGIAALSRAVAPMASSAAATSSSWDRLAGLAVGRDVSVAIGDEPAKPRQFLAVDASRLTVLDLSALPSDARRAILQIAREDADVLGANSTQIVERGGVRLTRDALFVRGQKLRDRADLVEVLPRESVREVSVASRDQRAEMYVAAGVLFGAAIAVNAYASAKQCGCGDAVFTKTGLGLSLGGVVALVSAAHTPRQPKGARSILYRRP